ncbi:MAG TPA: hypothetical protein PK597_06740, partial [Oscillospiraceae bacterium]|nr:hypothetical protein [Oscillospiraceae bacterium]
FDRDLKVVIFGTGGMSHQLTGPNFGRMYGEHDLDFLRRIVADPHALAELSHHTLMERFGVRRCFYGHLHGPAHHIALEGLRGKIDYTMVSADYLDFKPLKINEIF